MYLNLRVIFFGIMNFEEVKLVIQRKGTRSAYHGD